MGRVSRRKAVKLLGCLLAGVLIPTRVPGNERDIPIRGIYVPGWKGVNRSRIDKVVDFLVSNNLNALMIDVKNAHGELFYQPASDLANRIGAQVKTRGGHVRSLDLDYLVQESRKYGLRLIARHVVFADKVLFESIPSFGLIKGKTHFWVDLNRKEVVDYNLELINQEKAFGFDEIVLDYIRFPDMPGFGVEDDRCETIDGIVKLIKETLKGSGVQLGLQVFGYSAWSHYYSNVGQRIETLQLYSDVIYPMLYPSHFHKGTMGFAEPNDHPYEMITQGYREAISKIDSDCKIIPMIQGFSYSPENIKQQIVAVKELEMPGYISWNPSGNHQKLAEAIRDFKLM